MAKITGLVVRTAVKLVVASLVLAALVAAWNLRPEKAEEAAGAEVWTCSMHPQVRLPGPGKCPICGMDLVPVSKAKEGERVPAGLATEEVKPRELFKEVRTVGKLDYNERRVAYITARVAGRVDRLYADFAGIQVKKDDHLVDVYSPELVVAQDELIRAVEAARSEKGGDYTQATLEAARTKLRLLNLLPEQIAAIEKSRKRSTHLTIYAPIGGTVVEKAVREGQYVKEGDLLYRVADLDPLWLYLDVYEYDLGWVRFGQEVAVTVEAFPTETFRGRVVFIDPVLNDATRSVKVRVNLANPRGKLKPAMYASVAVRVALRPDGTPGPTGLEGKYVSPMHPEVVRDKPGPCPVCGMPLVLIPGRPESSASGHDGHAGHDHEPQTAGKVLAVPAGAVLDTGRRKVAYRRLVCGHYELVELKLGPRAEGKDDAGRTVSYYPVLEGVEPGDKVVVHGAFLLDSERQIEGRPSLLYPEGQSGADLHSGHAVPAKKAPSDGSHKH
ncbi:MAG: efflux RND transporter periplasmic adaptor subunit [Gemmataceae bacterium]